MSDERLAKKLKEILEKNTAVMVTSSGRKINNNEGMHVDADDAILEFLEDNGYTESAEQYKEMRRYFWYS